MVILPACLPAFCSVKCVFCFPFTPYAILQIIFLELSFSSFCLSLTLIFCYFHRWWYQENSVKWVSIQELSEVQCLFTEKNRNAISTEMVLVIIGIHLETFPVHLYLLWLNLCCGLDTMIIQCCVQAVHSLPHFFGSCLWFPLDIRFLSLLFRDESDASSMTESQAKSDGWLPILVLIGI